MPSSRRAQPGASKPAHGNKTRQGAAVGGSLGSLEAHGKGPGEPWLARASGEEPRRDDELLVLLLLLLLLLLLDAEEAEGSGMAALQRHATTGRLLLVIPSSIDLLPNPALGQTQLITL